MGTLTCPARANTIQNTRVCEQHSGSYSNQASKRSGRQQQQKAPEQKYFISGPRWAKQSRPLQRISCEMYPAVSWSLLTKWQGRFLREFFGASRKKAQQRRSILAYSGTCHRLVHWLLGVQPLNPPEDFLSLVKDITRLSKLRAASL